ncbi:hypothetical protein ACFSHQ_26620 [Gemmobacter lanyuensis]
MRFTGCAHATQLDLLRLQGKGPEPRADSADAALLQRQGDAHEAGHLERLKAQGLSVIEIDRGDLQVNAAQTQAALAAGPQVVFQGPSWPGIGAAGQTFVAGRKTLCPGRLQL